ncbi:uncharacterized protein L199_008610 [Kwoniella botswanensis]|uniref:uncharacterized protein n=1 Tax=Kwoniella botswanensis TaxID=1268659 RepID=UPI00315C4CC0
MALISRKRQGEDVEVDDLRTKMAKAFIDGESDKGKMDILITYPNNIDVHTRPVDHSYTSTNDDMDLDLDTTVQDRSFKVQYISASDYYFDPSNRREIDEDEEEYWKCRLSPSPRLVNYRYELSQDKYNSIEPDDLEFLSVSDLQGEMEDCHKRREVEANSRSR